MTQFYYNEHHQIAKCCKLILCYSISKQTLACQQVPGVLCIATSYFGIAHIIQHLYVSPAALTGSNLLFYCHVICRSPEDNIFRSQGWRALSQKLIKSKKAYAMERPMQNLVQFLKTKAYVKSLHMVLQPAEKNQIC